MSETPSKRRRKGREDYCPGAGPDDRDLLNPYLNERGFGNVHAQDWADGWNEAQAAYEAEQKDQSEEHWVMATFEGGVEEQVGEITFDSSNPPTELEIDGVIYKAQF
jgi:hypothetical protein